MNPSAPMRHWRALMQQHPVFWPKIAQCGLGLFCFFMPLLLIWHGYLATSLANLQQDRLEERRQQDLYLEKWQQATILPALKIRKNVLEQGLEQARQNAFDSADSGTVLDEVTRLAAHCQLTLEHAQPGTPVRHQNHIAEPLHLRLRGRYHDIGRFAAAIAASSHPLTLTDLQLARHAADLTQLSLETVVLSHHRHDPEQQR